MIGEIKPTATNGHHFILVAIDYFTKWVEGNFILMQDDSKETSIMKVIDLKIKLSFLKKNLFYI